MNIHEIVYFLKHYTCAVYVADMAEQRRFRAVFSSKSAAHGMLSCKDMGAHVESLVCECSEKTQGPCFRVSYGTNSHYSFSKTKPGPHICERKTRAPFFF